MNCIVRFDETGWRGKLGENITFANFRLIVRGYINFLKNNSKEGVKRVVLSFDSNFISKKIAREGARILSINGIEVILSDRDMALCTTSLIVIKKNCSGALDFRKDCRGLNHFYLQILNEKGQLIMPSMNLRIMHEIDQLKGGFSDFEYPKQNNILNIDSYHCCSEYLTDKLNIPLIKKSSKKFILDNMFGSSRDIIEKILMNVDVEMISIHNYEDPSFGGITPIINKRNLRELCDTVIKEKKQFGIAIDKDCCQIALVDGHGKIMDHELLQMIFLEYLVRSKKLKGEIVASVFEGINLKRLGKRIGREICFVKKDQRFLCNELESVNAIVAIEDSKSIIFNNEVKVKNGILYALLVIEMLAQYKFDIQSLTSKYRKIYPKTRKSYLKIDLNIKSKKKFSQILTTKKNNFSREIVLTTNFIQGIRFDFEVGRLLFHQDRKKQHIAIVTEAINQKTADLLLQEGRELFER